MIGTEFNSWTSLVTQNSMEERTLFTLSLVMGTNFLKDYWKICLSFSSNSIPSHYWKEVLTFFNWKNPPWRVKKASPCFQGRWRSRSSVFFPSRSWKLVFRFASLWSECQFQNSTSHVAGVSILVGYRKQSKSLEKSHVRLSVFPKTKLLSQNILLQVAY